MTYNELMRRMSKHILTEELPYDWQELPSVELAEFLVAHAWEPFQNKDAEEIYEIIDSLAIDVENLLKDEILLISALIED
jgi:hypothetical protein